MWPWYILTFVASFVVSVILKLKWKPGMGKYKIKWDDSMGTIHLDIPYGEGEANKFDLYLPSDKSKKSYKLVVYLHAGGFTSGDKQDDREVLQWLCSKGYVAAGVNYTLCSEQNPKASVYSQTVEIRDSIPHVVAAAAKLGYPIDAMAVAGGSAGGTLALIYAYRDARTSPVPVKMVYEAVGPGSFHHQDWKVFGLDKNPEAAAAMFTVMSGKEITPEMIKNDAYTEQIRDISADLWVDENTVPTVCAYGACDRMSPFEASIPLAVALKKHNIPHEYIVCPHSGHGLQNDTKLFMLYMKKVEEYLKKHLGL